MVFLSLKRVKNVPTAPCDILLLILSCHLLHGLFLTQEASWPAPDGHKTSAVWSFVCARWPLIQTKTDFNARRSHDNPLRLTLLCSVNSASHWLHTWSTAVTRQILKVWCSLVGFISVCLEWTEMWQECKAQLTRQSHHHMSCGCGDATSYLLCCLL